MKMIPLQTATRIKWLKIIHIFLISMIFIAAFEAKLIWAQTAEFSYKSIANIDLIVRGAESSQTLSFSQKETLLNVEKFLPEVLNDPIFKKSLPAFFVVIDFDWKKSAGYFSPFELRSGKPGFLIAPTKVGSEAKLKSMLAHESAHLLFHSLHPNADSWISEGFAMLIQSLFTGFLSPNIEEAFKDTSVTLTGDFDPKDESYQKYSHRAAQYGNVELYFHFLYRMCGEKFLNALLEKSNDVNPVQAFLSTAGCSVGSTFDESFRSFVFAKMKQDITSSNAYLVQGAYEASLKQKSEILNESYSALAYEIDSSQSCLKGEVEEWIGFQKKRACVRIRYR